jgi:hypothetical protein
LPDGNRTADATLNEISIRDLFVLVTKDEDFVDTFLLWNSASGRIALPLSRRGVPVHGIDLSTAMVARLRSKPGAEAIGDFATNESRSQALATRMFPYGRSQQAEWAQPLVMPEFSRENPNNSLRSSFDGLAGVAGKLYGVSHDLSLEGT